MVKKGQRIEGQADGQEGTEGRRPSRMVKKGQRVEGQAEGQLLSNNSLRSWYYNHLPRAKMLGLWNLGYCTQTWVKVLSGYDPVPVVISYSTRPGLQQTHGVCFTSDMDFQWHMNNARYLRNCDFARFTHFTVCGIYHSVQKLGARVLLAASNVRYRRSLQFLDVYRIHTKVLCWDEKAFYMEQRFERQKDSFVSAIVICKIAVTGLTPQHIVDDIQPGLSSPPALPEVSKWIESISFSSERLRKAS